MDFENKSSKLKLLFADDIMTSEVAVIQESTPIGQVAHLMLEKRISGYPVTNNSGEVVGIVTVTDLFRILDVVIKESQAFLKKYKVQAVEEAVDQIKLKPISSIMSSNVFTIAPDMPLVEILQKITEKNIHTFPVVKDGNLVGIVSRHDVLNATFRYG